MSIYKRRRGISIAVLVPMILLLLLSLHFKIWSGSYMEGDLESVVVRQTASFERGIAEEHKETIDELLRLFDAVVLDGTEINTCFWYNCCLFLCFVYCVTRPSITLCSLSVRMND